VTCAAMAREVAEETALLTSALAAEFEASVPTQALRERIDAAVLGERVANAGRVERAGLFASLANVFSFNSTQSGICEPRCRACVWCDYRRGEVPAEGSAAGNRC
jgi:hypothetical protein